jgi:hypothetical protein
MHDNSTRLGVAALPVYGLLVFLSTLTHQPDYRTDFHAYAEYVTTTSFLVSHLVGSILGTTIGIFGVLALGAVLATTGERRLAQRGLVLSVAGMGFIMALFGAAAFAQPASAGPTWPASRPRSPSTATSTARRPWSWA